MTALVGPLVEAIDVINHRLVGFDAWVSHFEHDIEVLAGHVQAMDSARHVDLRLQALQLAVGVSMNGDPTALVLSAAESFLTFLEGQS